jgi:hypothetical protein
MWTAIVTDVSAAADPTNFALLTQPGTFPEAADAGAAVAQMAAATSPLSNRYLDFPIDMMPPRGILDSRDDKSPLLALACFYL